MPQFEGPTYYTMNLDGISWTIPERYDRLEMIGNGTFGAVVKAIDMVTNRPVAIKKIAASVVNSFRAHHTYRELRILRQVS